MNHSYDPPMEHYTEREGSFCTDEEIEAIEEALFQEEMLRLERLQVFGE